MPALAGPEISFDAPANVGDEALTVGERISAEASTRPDHEVEARLSEERVKGLLQAFSETLHDRDLIIFRDRLLHERPATLEELGARFSVTRERMRQLEGRLKLRLRRKLEAELGDGINA